MKTDWILAKLRSIADRLLAKVRGEAKAIRTVEVRVRYNDFDECRRSESLNEPTDLESEVYPTLYRLLRKAWERRVSLRLVSVKVSGVYEGVFQAGLPLVNAGVDTAQQRRAAVVVDRLRARYGVGAVMRGHDLFLQRYGQAAKPPPAAVVQKKGNVEWAALNCRSGYSFLDSLLMPEHAVRLAVERGCRAVALTDPNLHGAVEFFIAAKDAGIKPVIGAEITVGNVPYCAYVRDRTGYTNLCALMSLPSIRREDFQEGGEGLI
ncbi:MAG: PHP domain-containing protein [Terrimicrobiaceae bacterium]